MKRHWALFPFTTLNPIFSLAMKQIKLGAPRSRFRKKRWSMYSIFAPRGRDYLSICLNLSFPRPSIGIWPAAWRDRYAVPPGERWSTALSVPHEIVQGRNVDGARLGYVFLRVNDVFT